MSSGYADVNSIMLYHESGLFGLSGFSNDVRELLASESHDASMAIDFFCLRVAQAIASLAIAVGGLDGLVFTAGIGENSPRIRQQVVDCLHWLGLSLDPRANRCNAARIDTEHSKARIFVVATDEERMIARHTLRLVRKGATAATDISRRPASEFRDQPEPRERNNESVFHDH